MLNKWTGDDPRTWRFFRELTASHSQNIQAVMKLSGPIKGGEYFDWLSGHQIAFLKKGLRSVELVLFR
jgi:hypothetical protein